MIDLFGTRRKAVEQTVLPPATATALLRHHPGLTPGDLEQVAAGLRQWYRVAQLAGTKPVAMPSRVVDDLWHAHITCTRDYAAFCGRAFGTFLHHRPEAAMSPDRVASNGAPDLRRTYDLAVGLEGPGDLPLLFRIDAALGIAGGRRFVRSCGRALCAGGPVTCLQHLPTALPRQRHDDRGDGGAYGGWGGGERDSAWSGGGGDGGSDGGGGGCGGGGD